MACVRGRFSRGSTTAVRAALALAKAQLGEHARGERRTRSGSPKRV